MQLQSEMERCADSNICRVYHEPPRGVLELPYSRTVGEAKNGSCEGVC